MALANWSAYAFHGGVPSSQRSDYLSPSDLFGYEEIGRLLPVLPDPSNASSSSTCAFGVMNSSAQEALPVVDFEGASFGSWCCSSSSSLLSFAQGDHGSVPCTTSYLNLDREDDDCDVWIDAVDQSNYQLNHLDVKPGTAHSWLVEDAEMVSAYGSIGSPVKDRRRQSAAEVEILQRSLSPALKGHQKRPYMEGDMPSPKKRCGSTRTSKDKQSPSKDPQSIAAKNRRERISERLKILQDLVPNGTKVDLVTMLEKAINYVKFLQLQVKVLATDEFWPAQGGRAPDIAQVKEAIDAILSSHRYNSMSKQ